MDTRQYIENCENGVEKRTNILEKSFGPKSMTPALLPSSFSVVGRLFFTGNLSVFLFFFFSCRQVDSLHLYPVSRANHKWIESLPKEKTAFSDNNNQKALSFSLAILPHSGL